MRKVKIPQNMSEPESLYNPRYYENTFRCQFKYFVFLVSKYSSSPSESELGQFLHNVSVSTVQGAVMIIRTLSL